jgi:hypothetical protein
MTPMKAIVSALALTLAAAFGDITCPIDNMSMLWTGKTTFEMGKMLQLYKCPMGHTTWVVK